MVSRMDAQATEEVSPSAPSGDTFELPETPDSLALDYISQTIMPAVEDEPEAEQEDLEPDEDEEPEDEVDEDDAEEDEELPAEESDEVEGEEPKAKMSADEWAETLFKDGAQRLSEIPGSMRADAIKKYGELHAKQAVDDAALIARAQLEAQLQWVKWTMNVDRQFEDDPDGKLAWLEDGSQEAQAYQQWKRVIESEPTPESRAQQEQSQRLNQLMQKQVERLKDYPDLQQQLVQKHQSNPYAANIDGLERLTDDVAELLVKVGEQTAAKRNEPAKKKAQKRIASAQNRAAVPRVDASRGRTASSNGKSTENTQDHDELLEIAFAKAFK